MSRYAVVGARTGELLTLRGRVIVHDDRAELEWFLPNSRVVRLSDGDIGPTLPLREHPDIRRLKIQFPLRREDFR